MVALLIGSGDSWEYGDRRHARPERQPVPAMIAMGRHKVKRIEVSESGALPGLIVSAMTCYLYLVLFFIT